MKNTPDKRLNYTRNCLKLLDFRGLFPRSFRAIHTINHVKIMQFYVCVQSIFCVLSHKKSCGFFTQKSAKTHTKLPEFLLIYRVNHTRSPEVKPERIK